MADRRASGPACRQRPPRRDKEPSTMEIAKRFAAACVVLLATGGVFEPSSAAQSVAPPSITGSWVPLGAGRGTDPALLPPPAGALVLKPEYARAYEAQRVRDAEATRRGEPPASAAVLCSPYGMPRMMAVASYPVEILQTSGQITMITEAYSEVRR